MISLPGLRRLCLRTSSVICPPMADEAPCTIELHAVGDGRLELVGRAGGAALVVVLQQLHGLAVPAAGGVDLVDGVAHGRAVGLARGGLRAGEFRARRS
jgi:hypothetical protein